MSLIANKSVFCQFFSILSNAIPREAFICWSISGDCLSFCTYETSSSNFSASRKGYRHQSSPLCHITLKGYSACLPSYFLIRCSFKSYKTTNIGRPRIWRDLDEDGPGGGWPGRRNSSRSHFLKGDQMPEQSIFASSRPALCCSWGGLRPPKRRRENAVE